MKKTKRTLTAVLAILALSFTGCGAVSNKPATSGNTSSSSGETASASSEGSDAEIKIIMGHEGNDDLADGILSLKFNELIEEKSGGRIVVDYKSNGTLGDEPELLQQVMNGSIQAACISTSTFSDYTDTLDALQLPFLYDDYEQERTALQSDEARALYAEVEELGVKITDVVEIGSRQFANKVRPITCMEDLKGIKMRIVPSTLLTEVANAIGMTSTPVAYSEIYSSLQSGVIDGEEINFISIVSNSHDEVLKYVSVIDFYSFPSALSFNLDWYNSLSAEDQALIEECSLEAMNYAMDQCEQIEKDSIDTCIERGLEINYIEDSEKQRFIDACEGIYEDYTSRSETIKNYVDYVKGMWFIKTRSCQTEEIWRYYWKNN